MSQWNDDKEWADQFMPEIKRILGLYVIGPAPDEDDRERNTDLIVLNLRPCRIACRIRKYKHLAEYGDQFTIRSGRPNGRKTELTKIIEGWGEFLFYGFADRDDFRLAHWTIADLNVFRIGLLRLILQHHKMPGIQKGNLDGSSTFHAFRWIDFPDIVVASTKLPDPLPAASEPNEDLQIPKDAELNDHDIHVLRNVMDVFKGTVTWKETSHE